MHVRVFYAAGTSGEYVEGSGKKKFKLLGGNIFLLSKNVTPSLSSNLLMALQMGPS